MMTERLSDAAVMYTERPRGRLVMTHRVSKSAQQPLSRLQKGSQRDAWSDTKTFMHEKQPVSTTQQLHRHQWTTDLSFLKGRGGSIGAFSIVNNEDKVLLHSRVSATDYGLTFVQSKSNLHCRKPRIHYSHQKTCGICQRLQRLGSVVHVGNHALPMKHKNNWNKVLRSARDVCLSPSVPLCYLE